MLVKKSRVLNMLLYAIEYLHKLVILGYFMLIQALVIAQNISDL